MISWWLITLAALLCSTEASTLNRQCRELLSCSIQKDCVNLPLLKEQMTNKSVSAQMYDDIDKSTDYGCIFTSGCQDECNDCPLCLNSKLQIVDILSGDSPTDGECPELIGCATKCVADSNMDILQINKCVRQTCAFHCFDGSCPKCSAFITRVFNQMCVAGEFRKRVNGFKGACFELFRDIVEAKFVEKFKAVGHKPAIG
ncbi:unnamed protein product [Caenorhabditis auriculariae]|uniref:DUF19 domain-containing protein n=1 Tax=Caenorhabditis auriculariae TaxID=2777116 RepID=A0A8S1HKF6_9PELO|nr:unnamed protein product [Caenorhabditis auriculariae]